MKYLLEATATIGQDDSNAQRSRYALSYAINKLKDVGQNAAIYDKELKMYFEDKSALATVYEVEVDSVYLDLDKSLVKAADFIRRTFYRYDWMQLRVNRQGKVLAVENSVDVVEQWNEIRTLLLGDYKGKSIEHYIDKIDRQIAEDSLIVRPLAQYFYFGLLFPAIPTQHNALWEHSRIISLSDFEDVLFEETITYERSEGEEFRRYNVTGKVIEGEGCSLEKFYGHIVVPYKDVHPTEAEVGVAYNNGDVDIIWNFKLKQI